MLFAIGFLQFRYLLGSSRANTVWDYMCLGVALIGLLMRIVVVAYVHTGMSGRGTKRLVASELNTTGAYSIVRHPLYVANFVIWFGVLLFFHNPMLLATGTLLYWLYYERIIVIEEAFLEKRFGPAFSAWVERTPALVPSLPWHFHRGERCFS